MNTSRLTRVLLPGLAIILFSGCNDDDAKPDLEPFRGTWTGATEAEALGGTVQAPAHDGHEQGAAVLEMEVFEGRIRGTLIVQTTPGISPWVAAVSGNVSEDGLHLEDDYEQPIVAMDLTLNGDGHLGGTIELPQTPDQSGTIALDRIPKGSVLATPIATYLQTDVSALAWDGQRLWVSTLGDDYILMSPNGQPEDTVAVFYVNDIHWNSNALAFGNGRLWGFIPFTLSPGFSGIRILPFTRDGILFGGAFVLHMQTSGLAHDGDHLWSLNRAAGRIYQISETGDVTDSLAVEHLDTYHLEYARGHFWCLGWYLPKLYELDTEGRVLRVYDLPHDVANPAPEGLAYDGNAFYYARGQGGGSTIFRLTIEERD